MSCNFGVRAHNHKNSAWLEIPLDPNPERSSGLGFGGLGGCMSGATSLEVPIRRIIARLGSALFVETPVQRPPAEGRCRLRQRAARSGSTSPPVGCQG